RDAIQAVEREQVLGGVQDLLGHLRALLGLGRPLLGGLGGPLHAGTASATGCRCLVWHAAASTASLCAPCAGASCPGLSARAAEFGSEAHLVYFTRDCQRHAA